ncbi:MAG: M23 family metallopeptidase [Bacteroidetes bacterium]|nr:MAG: M23 family metallopeptidase [Bacteroidota bacterium]
MKYLFVCISIIFILFGVTATTNQHQSSCLAIQQLFIKIRDGKIPMAAAIQELKKLLVKLEQQQPNSTPTLVFPIKGYNCSAIGGKNGSGFIPKGYSFFDGNKHKGHPAHDIFIRDSNQDCLDDKTHLPVPVVSVSNGIVISAENTWADTSLLRGGNYIWIYSPQHHSLFYYAHQSTVTVAVGDVVKAGQTIGYVGRSGLNANKKRSPTHLHFMQLKISPQYQPYPVNPFSALCNNKPS